MEISTELLKKFKDKMHITHSSEDDNLKELLSFSIVAIRGTCGDFEVEGTTDIDFRARELVFERTRYVYNDALEYFEDNFLSELTSLGLDIAFKAGDFDTTI
ncbi:phage gp6-like head-tail connector protein [Sutcliffiella horikoshii]|uniref:Phage gp6-like head-tail connector protein n=1 Tax=Sutcliffiella horikoshii TaxID=79883 RepID=A0A5D4SUL7_9BACI|nr:phage gp6-like head-tail connector protein [Sutcliffiella horikoshii]TYS67053.1 phage gp6-like head-tail connector protein [Sutcliffiella horikoshii]